MFLNYPGKLIQDIVSPIMRLGIIQNPNILTYFSEWIENQHARFRIVWVTEIVY